MRGATPFPRWSGLPVKMMSMHQISVPGPLRMDRLRKPYRRHRVSAAAMIAIESLDRCMTGVLRGQEIKAHRA
jgi:hypothetical protein